MTWPPDRIRQLRKDKKITQDELATLAHVTRQTVGTWEKVGVRQALSEAALESVAKMGADEIGRLLGRGPEIENDGNPSSPIVAGESVAEVLRAAQLEQLNWLRRFADRVMAAQLAQFRAAVGTMTLEELLEMEREGDELDEEIKARRRESGGGGARTG